MDTSGVAEMTALIPSRKEGLLRLFSDSREPLRRYIRKVVKCADTADEIVQEAFLRTYEHGNAIEVPRAFLFRTAKNLALNERRHQRVAATEFTSQSECLGSAPAANTTESEAVRGECLDHIYRAVERLPRHSRAAFVLRIFHGYSYSEVAQALGLSIKTVEKHIARGLHEVHTHVRRRYP